MLDIIIDVFKKGGSKDLDIPQPSSVYPSPPPITRFVTTFRSQNLFFFLKKDGIAVELSQ